MPAQMLPGALGFGAIAGTADADITATMAECVERPWERYGLLAEKAARLGAAEEAADSLRHRSRAAAVLQLSCVGSARAV